MVPGVSVRKVVDSGWGGDGVSAEHKNGNHIWIGRSRPLTSNKSQTHFPLLKQHTGIAFDEMLFFDDCNWSDHCTMVSQKCVGVVSQRVPYGIDEEEWREGLRRFAEAKNNSSGTKVRKVG